MTHKQVLELLDELHRNKEFHPTDWEKKFLEDLSFYATLGPIKISDKQGKMLQSIYRKSQGG